MKSSEEQVFRDLQKHLDKQPIGFPATRSGSDIRLLKRLFGSEEARLAMRLSYKPRALDSIYRDVENEISREALSNRLQRMSEKGVIGNIERNDVQYFFNIPLLVGMFEGQLHGLTLEFLADFGEYVSSKSFGLEFLSSALPQMRTIPIEKSIQVEHHVATYDQLANLIHENQGPFVIKECICRKAARLMGDACHKTSRLETCMALGEVAKHFIKTGKGREVTRQEALDISRQNEVDGLVLQPSNSQKPEFICACCGCCCGMIRLQKMLPRPLDFWASNFHASVDPGACIACETCIERCQVDAMTLDSRTGVSKVDLSRCIGCGNCVSTCPSGSIRLVRKAKGIPPPETRESLYDAIMARKKGALGKMLLATRLMLQK